MRSIYLIVFALLLVHQLQSQTGDVQKLGLQDCIDIALEKNLNIKRGELDVEDQEITQKLARFSQLPNLNVGGNYGSNWGRSIDPTTNLFISQRIGFTGLNGSSNWVLFSGLQNRNTISQSNVDLQARYFDLERAKNEVMLRVMDAYLNVIFNDEQQENARYQVESTREQLEQTKLLVNAGSVPIINQLNLESQLASDELLLVQNENAYNLAILSLKQLMLLPASAPIEIDREEVEVAEIVAIAVRPDDIFTMAKNVLPQMKSAELGIQSADYSYKIAKAGRYPTLSVNAGFNTNYSTVADRARPVFDGVETVVQEVGFLTSDPTQTVSTIREIPRVVEMRPDFGIPNQFSEHLSRQLSLSLQVPIFNRFQTSASIQRSKLTQQRAEINAQEVSIQVRQDIETAYNDAVAASKSFDASSRQVSALEESFRIIQSQYNIGAVNFTDFQVASNNLVRAKSDLIRAKYQYIFRIKILDFYQGKPITF